MVYVLIPHRMENSNVLSSLILIYFQMIDIWLFIADYRTVSALQGFWDNIFPVDAERSSNNM